MPSSAGGGGGGGGDNSSGSNVAGGAQPPIPYYDDNNTANTRNNNHDINNSGGASGGPTTTATNSSNLAYYQQQQHGHPHSQPHSIPPAMTTTTAAAASNNNNMSDGPRNKCDAIVFEAIAKAAEIVVGSRCWIDGTGGTQHQQNNFYNNNHTSSPSPHQNNNHNQSNPASRGYGNGKSSSNNNNGTTTSRFNLLVPEVQGVRSILQRWKRALHVPLRLDVYYQHPDSQRELLERWCLEYAPGGGPSLDFLSTDPIVQLRHVCKNIVIWLRTLYCFSHTLPAQALRKLTMSNNGGNNPIGFSIYVVSEGQDDVSGLVSSQGFHSQGQPRSVHTPYGELGWKVFYAPKASVQKLLPEVLPYCSSYGTTYASLDNRQHQQGHHQQQQHSYEQNSSRATTTTQPIPMRNHNEEQRHHHHNHHDNNNVVRQQGVVQSAPQHTGFNRLYRRSNSDANETAAKHAAKSYHHRREMLMRAGRAKSGDLGISHNELEGDSTGYNHRGYGNFGKPNGSSNGDTDEDSDRPPTKNLSALSLALMMSDEQVQSIEGSSVNSIGTDDEGFGNANINPNEGQPAVETETAAAEKRRQAFHSTPPQFSAGVAAAAGEYGYAYNSHIPAVHQTNRGETVGSPMTPNASNTASSPHHPQGYGTSVSSSYSSSHNPSRQRSGSSPSMRPSTPLGATPPGYLLSGTPVMGGMVGGTTPGGSAAATLIPPRSSVTPPFVRPVGFMVDPPQQPLPPTASSTQENSAADPNNTTRKKEPADLNTALQQHQTSLDLLHSSPFQYPPGSFSFHNSGLHQQLFSAGEGAVLAPAAFMNEFYHRATVPPEEPSFTSGFPAAAGGSMASGQDLEYDDGHDMPFAVDSGSLTSHPAAAGTGATSTQGLASMMNEASLVASMCTAAPKRLAMFDSKSQTGHGGENGGSGTNGNTSVDNIDTVMDSLASQLADFHSFGASLTDSQALHSATASASS